MNALTSEVRDGIALITIDLPGEAVNKITAGVRKDFTELIGTVTRDRAVRAVVLQSGKSGTFLAGADLDELVSLSTAAEAERLSRAGHALLDALATLRVPVVAAIHGACLGGGLETVLACRHRIATDHPETMFALPEVQLGLIPGAGGTQRLPRTIGLSAALDLILTGRTITARRAWRLGLVHEIVHPSILGDVAFERARALADQRRPPAVRRPGRGARRFLLDDTAVGRALVFRRARASVRKRTRGHYPAPLAALAAVHAGFSRSRGDAYATEARLFGEMVETDVSRELIALFFATTALKRDPGVSFPAPEPHPIARLGVLGAGFMGAGIASVAVQHGTPVRLRDTDPARVGRGVAAVHAILTERLRRGRLTAAQRDEQMVLLGGTTDLSGFRRADLVVEAVFEDLPLKRRVLQEVEPLLGRFAVYASNTSTIPIARIAEAAARPTRVLGMHFFSPVHRMPLLEVVTTPYTDRDATVTAVAYGKRLGKTVIVVNDAPGFYTTRTLGAYVNEAGRLLDEGVAIDRIDRALVEFGFPVGPITLLDEVGLDVAGRVGESLAEAYGARSTPSESLRRVVESGRTGRKGRSGFYRYEAAGERTGVDASVYALFPHGGVEGGEPVEREEIVQRCVLAMVNEAARCLEEGVLRSPRDGDVGAVLGLGFPPFRGGPFRHVDRVGAVAVVGELDELNGRFPGRFSAADVLVEHARGRRRFHGGPGGPTP